MTTGLIVIDVQDAMVLSAPPPHDRDGVIGRVAGLQAAARAAGVPVIHVQHDGGPGDPLERGSAGWQIHRAVAPVGDESVVEKRWCSAFQSTSLDDLLKARGIDALVIAGMQTDYCVDTTCRAAAALGYRVVLAEDAHTTFDTPVLTAAQIIAHTNFTLGRGFVTLRPARAIRFAD